MLPGRWSRQCPHSQTGRAQVYADSIGLANCGAILGPWGTSQSFSDASNCCHRCQGSDAPGQENTGSLGTLKQLTRALLESEFRRLEGETVRKEKSLHLLST